jgi:hypothetical protein
MVEGMKERIFLLSPARCDGRRAAMVMNDQARFELAMKLRAPAGAALGEVFSFMSGLYFRGKLAYARRFSLPSPGICYVITTNRGLMEAECPVRLSDLKEMGCNGIDANDSRYRRPLERDIRRLMRRAGDGCEFVLLGSVASGKYVDVLVEALGERLKFPSEFVGRGDMSRGGLMLRCVEQGRELEYVPVKGTIRTGKRPAKLVPRPGLLSGS